MSTASTPARLDDFESAAALVVVERTRKPPDKMTLARLDAVWGDAFHAAEDQGQVGVDHWLKVVASREPDRHPGIAAALTKARHDAAFPRISEPPAEASPEAPPERPAFLRSILSATELARTEFRTEWLVKGILVADQPCVVGAAKKGMKTSTMLDLAVSLASGLAFLGEFAIPGPVPVLMLSGESGGFATKATIGRVCAAKGLRIEDLGDNLHVGFELPRLNNPADVLGMADAIRELGVKVVIIDPLYLCLISGAGGRQLDPKNLFDIGPLLLEVSRICLEAGATPILVHHNKLTTEPFAVPDLASLAYAGIQEFARQWILLGRRERYEPGSGQHKLWLAVGGSTGHSGEWAFDVDEGVMDDDFHGRKWDVQVRKASEERAEEQAAKTTAKAGRQLEKELAQLEQFHREEDKVLAAIRQLGGKASRSKAYAAAGLNSERGRLTLARLEADGRLVEMEIGVGRGRGSSPITGVGLAELRHTPTNPDEP